MKDRSIRTDRGVVSFMVTLVMLLVMTMIVLGFAQVSRREQRQSLDRQLSAQAFLAAESGVNDARQALQTALQSGATSIADKTQCDNTGVGVGSPYASLPYDPTNKVYTVDSNHDVYYTCLLVSTKLPSVHQTVNYDGPAVGVPIHPSGGAVSALYFKWWLADPTTRPKASACNGSVQPFVPAGSWSAQCYGVLRVDMVPTGGVVSRSSLTSQQRTYFFYPINHGGTAPSVSYAAASNNGKVIPMYCTDTNCNASISGIGGSSTYALRLSSMYVNGAVDICPNSSTCTSGILLSDAQAQVDVTGRAQDVLRRIQVRIPLSLSNEVPNDAIESGASICKRFQYDTNRFQNATDFAFSDPTNPMCN